ncbi:hypothetical protein Ga0609869_000038 [Rhodovulum iodosum]|uniref:Uncharacterized protein n=1 Tax=Rhodovulum iodosum TaxID=68291 RepID=A0ABV3XPH6_9RHOB
MTDQTDQKDPEKKRRRFGGVFLCRLLYQTHIGKTIV